MANFLSLTSFTSRTLGTMFQQYSPFIKLSYKGVREFQDHRGYGVNDIISIKIPGYPAVERGLTTIAAPIVDRVVPYVISDNDIYNVSYNINIREFGMHFVGGKASFMGSPNLNPDSAKNMNPQAKTYIDNYVTPAYQRMNGDLELELSGKCGAVASYCAIDDPASLGAVDSFSAVSSVTAMMDELGFNLQRFAIMNVTDENKVSNSLQNMYNTSINAMITRENKISGATSPSEAGRLARNNVFVSNSIAIQESCAQYIANPTNTGITVSAITENSLTLDGVESSTAVLITKGTLISLPSSYWINKTNGVASSKRIVVAASEDAVGDGAGKVTITLGMGLIDTGTHRNITAMPTVGDIAVIFPGHRKNFFFVPMGIVANSLMLAEIAGADNETYVSNANDVRIMAAMQGVVSTALNQLRMSLLCPTLAIPDYIVVLPSAL